jgi:acyl-CoA hydrolase
MPSIILRFLTEPGTANFGGRVNGGTVMKWIDEAGYACATGWAKRDCVMVSMGSIRFQRPIMIGDLVEAEARLAYTGKTSMNLSVEVRSGDMKTGQMEIIADCLAVFVALDRDGKTLPVQAWLPETPGDIAMAQRIEAHLNAARIGHSGL